MFEELLIGTNVAGTEHPRILRAVERCLPWDKIELLLRELAATVQTVDCRRARELLQNAIEECQPGEPIQDLVWMKRNGVTAVIVDSAKVTNLSEARAPELSETAVRVRVRVRGDRHRWRSYGCKSLVSGRLR